MIVSKYLRRLDKVKIQCSPFELKRILASEEVLSLGICPYQSACYVKGETPLHSACIRGDAACVKVILHAARAIYSPDTPTLTIEQVDNLPIPGIDRTGAYLERDVYGQTPLHCTLGYLEEEVTGDHRKIVSMLLKEEFGTEACTVQDVEGKTPLSLAVYLSDYRLVKQLTSARGIGGERAGLRATALRDLTRAYPYQQRQLQPDSPDGVNIRRYLLEKCTEALRQG